MSEDVKLSPYRYYDGYKVVIENERAGCDVKMIENKASSGAYGEVKQKIMTALYFFGVVSAHTLTEYLIMLDGEDAKPSIKRDIALLVKHGVILRLVAECEGHRTPPMYALSAGGKKYVERHFVRPKYFKKASIPTPDLTKAEEVIRLAVFNQFSMRLDPSSYQFSEQWRYLTISPKSKNGLPLVIDGAAIMLSSDGVMRQYDFIFLTIRMTKNWKRDFRLRLLGAYSELGLLKMEYPQFIILCESYAMATEAEQYRMSMDLINQFDVYYLPDIDAAFSEPFSYVYKIDLTSGTDLLEIPLHLKK